MPGHRSLGVGHGSPCLCLLFFGLFVAGCAHPNVNPPQARANAGYADFYAGPAGELCWEVARFDEATQGFRRVFSELKPPEDRRLRLAFPPGHHHWRVTFLNRVIATPVEVAVEVQDGKITPVRVTLTEAGTAWVETREFSCAGTEEGRYGRRTRIGSDETRMYNLASVADPPVAYQPKERMPYAC